MEDLVKEILDLKKVCCAGEEPDFDDKAFSIFSVGLVVIGPVGVLKSIREMQERCTNCLTNRKHRNIAKKCLHHCTS